MKMLKSTTTRLLPDADFCPFLGSIFSAKQPTFTYSISYIFEKLMHFFLSFI